MRNRFNVDSDEKRRIISLHENSLKKNYLNLIVEQEQYYKGTDGKVGMLQGPQILPAGATAITKQEYDTSMASQNATNNDVKPEVKAAGNQEWLTFPGDKNYTYQKQNGKWVAKNKAGKVYDMSKYPSSVAKLEKQFPGGKAPASTPSGGSVDTNQQSSVNSQVGGTSSTADTQKNNVSGGEGKVSELTGTKNLNFKGNGEPLKTTIGALVPFRFQGLTNDTTKPITIKQAIPDTNLVTTDLKLPMTLQPKQSTGTFQVFVKVVDLEKSGDGWTPNQQVNSDLDVAGPLRMKAKFLGYDIQGKLKLYGNDNTFITLTFIDDIIVKN